MGEHTIREILRRRSPETQRAMQRRRQLAQGAGRAKGMLPLILVVLVILGLIGGAGYLGYVAHGAVVTFEANKAGRNPATSLTLAGVSEFLPNTLLAAEDPAFYNSSGLNGALLTRRLMRLYYPDASALEIRAMAVMVESQAGKTEIMEALINDVPMGGNPAHPVKGFAAASNYYFGKPFNQLAPQDVALLVAIAGDPHGLDPRKDPAKAQETRNVVLQADMQQNVLSEAQVDGLSKLPLDVTPSPAG